MRKIVKYVFSDIIRSRMVLGYTVVLLLLSLSLFSFESNTTKGLLSLLNIILIVVPLISIVFSTIYIYNSAEFIELLVSQPLKRKHLWGSLFLGLAGSLSLAFLLGAGIPLLIFAPAGTAWVMVLMGVFLSVIFVSLAMLAAVITRDKARGIGVAIFLWLYFSLLFDSVVLFLLFQFQDYPLEKGMIVASALNPIDLGRIMILLKMDISALMGFTGALFRDFFGSQIGFIVAVVVMLTWMLVAFWVSLRKFTRKDL